MEKGRKKRVMGWEVAQKHEQCTIRTRMILSRQDLKASVLGILVWSVLFLVTGWIMNPPADSSLLSFSSHFFEGIIWPVVLLAIVFEFLDSAAGMGYGTAFTPLLLVMGYDPLQIVPVIMIQQACAGLISAYIHREYGNVEWKFHPPSETVKLWLIIASTGSFAVIFSITSVYGVLKLAKDWLKLYVILLLLIMGIVAFVKAKRSYVYRPKRMYCFGALAGLNKGIGGGGYGPVITVGGLLSGVPAKTMMAVTALSEGTVCLVSIIVWFSLLNCGVMIDFMLLPSMILGSALSVVAAPYATRVFPETLWRTLVPIYCCVLAAVSLWRLLPTLFWFL